MVVDGFGAQKGVADRDGRQKEDHLYQVARDDADVSPSRDDPYAIINKNHHWGGKYRLTGRVNITMNIGRFLRGRPDGMDAVFVPEFSRIRLNETFGKW